MEHQVTAQVIVHVMNIIQALYGALVNYSSYCLCDELSYKPYMEHQLIIYAIHCVVTALVWKHL